MKKKKQLYTCGGTCKELSAVIILYGPNRPLKLSAGLISFQRVMYCINCGCGWKESFPEVKLNINSNGTKKWLQKEAKKLNVSVCFLREKLDSWSKVGTGKFIEWLKLGGSLTIQ